MYKHIKTYNICNNLMIKFINFLLCPKNYYNNIVISIIFRLRIIIYYYQYMSR